MRRAAAALLLAACGCAGLSPVGAPDALLYGSAKGVGGQAEQVVIARGTVRGRDITLVVTSAGSAPVRLNYTMDEFIARTHDGRAVILDKGDVLRYPDLSAGNPADPFVVRLPREVSAAEVTELEARLNHGQTVLVLKPIQRGLRAPAQEPVVQAPRPLSARMEGMPMVPSEPVIAPRAAALATLPEPVAASLAGQAPGYWSPELDVPAPAQASGGLVPALPAAPVGERSQERTVPTTLEVQQALGSSLPVEIRWNEASILSLGAGEHRTFQLLPGHHELDVVCRMAGIATTAGRVPVTAWPEQAVRVLIETRAGLKGAQVRVRVWQGTRLATDQAFAPSPETYSGVSS
jgi:hypothetical protein